MKIRNDFVIPASVDDVWELFQSVESVAECLPGATLNGRDSAGAYSGAVAIRVGPIRAQFEGTASVESDELTRTGRIHGSGADRKGGSRGAVEITYSLREVGGDTNVVVDSDITLSGAAAQFGRVGLIEEISEQLVGQFVNCLQNRFTDEGEPAERPGPGGSEVSALAIAIKALVSWIRRLFGEMFRGPSGR